MAPKIDGTDNVVFLLRCIETSNLKIDFNKAASALNTTPNAARMRYSRLRKSTQDDHTGEPFLVAPPVVRRINRPKQIAESKKCKRHSDEGSVVENDHTNENDEMLESAPRRATRSTKIDYSTMFSKGESLNGSNIDDKSSNFESESDVQNEDSQVTIRTPPRAVPAKIPTPPQSKKSIKQVSMSPEFRCEHTKEAAFPDNTPPQSAKRFQFMGTALTEDIKDVRVDLSTLESGQKFRPSMFKRRRINFIEQDMEDHAVDKLGVVGTTGGLARVIPLGSCLKASSNMEFQGNNIFDSVSPDDSISCVDKSGRRESTEEDGGRTFMQRLSALWN